MKHSHVSTKMRVAILFMMQWFQSQGTRDTATEKKRQAYLMWYSWFIASIW
jgi:hypothetical protein